MIGIFDNMEKNTNLIEQKFEEYLCGREPYFYWVEIPKTRIWYDAGSNAFKTNIGIDISFENYDIEDLSNCMYDLFMKIILSYREKGIILHEDGK